MNKRFIKNVLGFLGLPILIIIIISIINNLSPRISYNYSEILGRFKRQEVVEYSMNLGSGDMEIKLNDGTVIYYSAPNVNLMYMDIKDYIEQYNNAHSDKPMTYNLIKPMEMSWITNIVSFIILPIIMFSVMIWLFMRRITPFGEGGRQFSFGSSRVRTTINSKKSTFEDVVGMDEEKEELKEIVDFLKHPEKYSKLGAKIPKAVLLVGPPGTGKTLLSRAVAGEAGVPFFQTSGSEFEELFVGVGASRIRDLFDQAKKNAPSIVFIDEIDSVGRKRGSSYDSGRGEQTLNQLLVEMDGFGINEGVIIIATTNRPDILDPALTRPGRFDRQVVIGYPDIKGREEILQLYAKGKPFTEDVKLKTIAKATAGFTGADLENLINEAAILAVRKKLERISMVEIEEATVKVVVGNKKTSHIITEDEKKITAYHESGHAITSYFCETQDKVHEISIIPRGQAGGYTLSLPEKDRMYHSKQYLMEDIAVALGGRVAEELVIGDISTGASSDIKKATNIARLMVTEYGMSDLGPIYCSDDESTFFDYSRNHSESMSSKIDGEINKIISECYNKSKDILKSNIELLHKVSEYLLKNERVSESEFEKLMTT